MMKKQLDTKNLQGLHGNHVRNAKDFVVDDVGLGYCDIGEEDDRDTNTLNYSSKEEQGTSSSKKKLSSENKKKK
ncbi:hypothetical protein SUGI_0754760 [Cryptomeria japonica]|nr:hypothetical protein SUGI_0754760 [Cryptomeria japonica]